MTTKGIDPTIHGFASEMAFVELFSRLDEAAIKPHAERLAEAFQKAFEDWAEDLPLNEPSYRPGSSRGRHPR